MIKSMTGYGRCEKIEGTNKILAEIKSVNHRYSDYTIKTPRFYGFLEERIRNEVSKYVHRGKIDIFIAIENYDDDAQILLKESFAANYIDVLKRLRDDFDLEDDISVMTVAKNQEIFNIKRQETDEDAIWAEVKPVFAEALSEFTAMREREGERILKDLEARIEYMKTLSAKIDERSPKTVEEYRERLLLKIKEVLEDREIDEARVLTEVAIFADKIAVNEEMVRLGSHFEEFYNILSSGEPAGRKLDFLIQEINREINTTGSKANDIEIARLVVDLKAETEKLREQIQNIE